LQHDEEAAKIVTRYGEQIRRNYAPKVGTGLGIRI